MGSSVRIAWMSLALAAVVVGGQDVGERARQPLRAAPEPPRTILVGRVLDEHGEGLAGARVRVRLRGGPTFLQPGGDPRHSPQAEHAAHTAADGSFALAFPAPGERIVWLDVLPESQHCTHFEILRQLESGAFPTGTVELGERRLGRAGSVSGVVRDGEGRPIPGALVSTYGDRETGGSSTRADDGGRYELQHVRPGRRELVVEHEDHLRARVGPVEVTAGGRAEAPELRMELAPRIAGLVVDQDGRPIAHQALRLSPVTEGEFVTTRTDADGRFDVALRTPAPHRISSEDVWCEGWPTQHEAAELPPHVEDARVALRRHPRVRIAVVDARTGAPVERFGIEIEAGEERPGRVPVTCVVVGGGPAGLVTAHPGGEVELVGYAGIDRLTLVAPGYRSIRGLLQSPPPGAERLELRLEQGASVRGRALRNGAPAAGVEIHVESGHMQREMLRERPDGGDLRVVLRWDPDAPARFVPDHRPRLAGGVTDASGRFDIPLLPGAYRVELGPVDGEAARSVAFELAEGETRVLGELELAPLAAIAGRLRLPAGVSPADLEVVLDPYSRRGRTRTDAEGRFRFEGLVPGEHLVKASEEPRRLTASEPLRVETAPGETLELELDLTEHGRCELTLHVEGLYVSFRGAQLDLLPLDPGHERIVLGAIGKEPPLHGFPRAPGEGRVALRTLTGLELIAQGPPLRLTPGGRVERTLRFETGALIAILPERVELPERGELALTLEPREEDERFPRQTLRIWYGEGSPPRPGLVLEPATRRIGLEEAPCGRLRLVVELFDGGARTGLQGHDEEGRPRNGRRLVYRGEADVLVLPGANPDVLLP